MNKETMYYLVDSRVLPEVFSKVMQTKKILGMNDAVTINDATKKTGISRSTYYKYKDSVLPFYETSRGKVMTLLFVLEDISGILSNIVMKMADAKANILTINQNIPINGLADVSISIETAGMKQDLKEMMDSIGKIEGVRSYKILAREKNEITDNIAKKAERAVNIAVLGYGTIGSGVVEALEKNGDIIGDRCRTEIKVKRILEIREFRGPNEALRTGDAEDIFTDPDISIVVETIGGTGAAFELTKKALASGRHVVTSNKDLVALHGPELLQLAHDNNVNYMFEASVGGGIPIIRPLNKCLAANRIMSITGIVNGTTNYILTKMKNEGMSFDDALKEARRKGYVESNPKEDIDGYDAARKLSILSTIAFDEFIDYRKIRPEGISRLSMIDMEYADSIDSVIKLLAIGKRVSKGIFCKVAPVVLQKTHPLASVEDIFNAIVVEGNILGDAMFYGRGAGKLPTASAIIADIMDIVNNVYSNGKRLWKIKEHSELIDSEMYDASLFVRVGVIDMPAAKELIINKMGEVRFVDIGKKYEIAFITQQERESTIRKKIKQLPDGSCISSVLNIIMMYPEAGING